MLHVACVRWGEAFGSEYVEILHDMVRRNLPEGFRGRFVCLTDRPEDLRQLAGVETQPLPPGLSGWWSKLELFRPGAFPNGDQVLYFDLDTVITGGLDDIAKYPGAFGILRDAYRPHGWQSSVLGFQAGTKLTDAIWEEFQARRPLHQPLEQTWPGGDQQYLELFWSTYNPERMRRQGTPGRPWPPDLWQELYPKQFASYKVDARTEIPKGCRVVFFHGHPRPHQVRDGWVPEVWKVGGGTVAELFMVPNVAQDVLVTNARLAHADESIDWFEVSPPHQQMAIIVGGGPSMTEHLGQIAVMQRGGGVILATNNTDKQLRLRGITPDAHVVCDGKPQNVQWYCPGGKKLYASIVDPGLRALAQADKEAELTMWDPLTEGLPQFLPKDWPLVGGGSTIGLRALSLAYGMGFRRMHLFGFDSSYRGAAHHAYAQPQNDGERVIDVTCGGERFRCAPWMWKQAEEFREIATELLRAGVEICVWGDGLIPRVASMLTTSAAEERARAILERLPPGPVRGAEIGVFRGALSRLLLERSDLTLLMVDSWSTEHSDAYRKTGDYHTMLTALEQLDAYSCTAAVTAFAGDRARIIRNASVAAAESVLDESLDFVFIDADHSFEGCATDITAWFPKVRPGGLICGHDYDNPELPDGGVKRAVCELLGEVELGANFTWFKTIARD